MEQWGKSSTKTATFPLKFPSAALIAVNTTDDAGSGNNYDNRLISITTSAITISYGSFRYIVIGKQLQWGLIPETHTVDFPIPFKNIFSITISGNEPGNGNVPVWGMLVVNTTNSKATADVKWKYIAVGTA